MDRSRRHRATDAPWERCEGRGVAPTGIAFPGEQRPGTSGGEKGLSVASAADVTHGELGQQVVTEVGARDVTGTEIWILILTAAVLKKGSCLMGGRKRSGGLRAGFGDTVNPVCQLFQESHKMRALAVRVPLEGSHLVRREAQECPQLLAARKASGKKQDPMVSVAIEAKEEAGLGARLVKGVYVVDAGWGRTVG
ncbi:hypothetical protein NDU88_000196 [Pleurodeles waltl]|uniref:Uncharacterized protein n=1 Tax=Pleurodeles waltl TaxID=8319 RepID=A0AAV7TER8_PLEWA|nr:hypothetical protein NDU88_000196 [Pleurodeles waltl]